MTATFPSRVFEESFLHSIEAYMGYDYERTVNPLGELNLHPPRSGWRLNVDAGTLGQKLQVNASGAHVVITYWRRKR